MAKWLLSTLGAALLLAGCGGSHDSSGSQDSPGRAQTHLLEDIFTGQLEAAYATLHPAYQRLVSRQRFVACARANSLGNLDSIKVLEVYDDTVEIPGSGQVPAKAVRVQLTSSNGKLRPFVNHEVRVGSDWRWVMNRKAVKAYRAGRCPGG
jgi:hypothetical protein